MRIKVVQINEKGKIELTVRELQDLLNEAYDKGWDDKPYGSCGPSYGGITYLNSDSTSNSAAINGTIKDYASIELKGE